MRTSPPAPRGSAQGGTASSSDAACTPPRGRGTPRPARLLLRHGALGWLSASHLQRLGGYTRGRPSVESKVRAPPPGRGAPSSGSAGYSVQARGAVCALLGGRTGGVPGPRAQPRLKSRHGPPGGRPLPGSLDAGRRAVTGLARRARWETPESWPHGSARPLRNPWPWSSPPLPQTQPEASAYRSRRGGQGLGWLGPAGAWSEGAGCE